MTCHCRFLAFAALALATLSSATADAGIFRGRHGSRCAPPACGAPVGYAHGGCGAIGGHYEEQVVEKTIYVNEMQTEKRTVTATEYADEVRERTYTVKKCVPYTETLTQEYTVMVQKTEMRTVTQTVYRKVPKQVEQTYTVMVPYQETRQGVRNSTVCEPETLTRTVCVDRGHYETREVQVPCAGYGYRGVRCGSCGGCGSCASGPCGGCGGDGLCAPPTVTQCIRVWVPNMVQEERSYTVLRPKLVQTPYEYTVTLCRPETKTRTVTTYECVAEQVSKEVPVTVCVPEKKTRTVEVTKYREEAETKTEKYTVRVPKQVTKEVAVQVCRSVPKTVQQTIRVWVPDPAPAAGCGPTGGNCGTPAGCAPGCATPGCTTPAGTAL